MAWLLERQGSHGHSSIILRAWLSRLGFIVQKNDQGETAFDTYSVATERYLLSNQESRVDIEIDGSNFFIIVEVKIDAIEGRDQVARYVELAELKAHERPFCVIVIAPRKISISSESPYVISTTWRELALTIRSVINPGRRENASLPYHVVIQFANHIANL